MIRKIFTLFVAVIIVFSAIFLSSCKERFVDDENTVNIVILERGYGTVFLEKLAEAYNAREDKTNKIIVAKKVAEFDFMRTALTSKPGTNNYDIYFTVDEMLFDLLARGKSVIPGYDKVLADLSDLYEQVPEGYDEEKTVRELMDPYYLDCMTYYEDDKQYFVPWAIAFGGLVYNKKLFDKYSIELPRTTEELFDIMDRMKVIENNGYAKVNKNNVYPFIISGDAGYTEMLSLVWWMQYEGISTFYNFMEGKTNSGIYSPQIYLQNGLRKACELMNIIMKRTGGYVNPDAIGYDFKTSQVKFLGGEAFMMCNGDWLDKEADKHYKPGEIDVRYMKPPVISSIIENLPKDSIEDEDDLRAVIDYIDGNRSTKPIGVEDEDVEYVRTARNMAYCGGGTHSALIPSYSNNIEGAKDFLLFMLSKQGMEIMMQQTAGNTFPLMVDYSELSGYSTLSNLQKTKFEITTDAIFIGRKYNRPMFYKGGLYIFRKKLEDFFGVSPNSDTYKKTDEYIQENYKYYESNWTQIMKNAGVAN